MADQEVKILHTIITNNIAELPSARAKYGDKLLQQCAIEAVFNDSTVALQWVLDNWDAEDTNLAFVTDDLLRFAAWQGDATLRMLKPFVNDLPESNIKYIASILFIRNRADLLDFMIDDDAIVVWAIARADSNSKLAPYKEPNADILAAYFTNLDPRSAGYKSSQVERTLRAMLPATGWWHYFIRVTDAGLTKRILALNGKDLVTRWRRWVASQPKPSSPPVFRPAQAAEFKEEEQFRLTEVPEEPQMELLDTNYPGWQDNLLFALYDIVVHNDIPSLRAFFSTDLGKNFELKIPTTYEEYFDLEALTIAMAETDNQEVAFLLRHLYDRNDLRYATMFPNPFDIDSRIPASLLREIQTRSPDIFVRYFPLLKTIKEWPGGSLEEMLEFALVRRQPVMIFQLIDTIASEGLYATDYASETSAQRQKILQNVRDGVFLPFDADTYGRSLKITEPLYMLVLDRISKLPAKDQEAQAQRIELRQVDSPATAWQWLNTLNRAEWPEISDSDASMSPLVIEWCRVYGVQLEHS